MNKKITIFLIVTILGTLHISSIAQTSGRKLYPGMTKTRHNSSIPIARSIAYRWTWMVGLGRTTYLGTLCEDCYFKFRDLNFQINAGLKYRFDTRFSVGGSLRYMRISASDGDIPSYESGLKQRNLSFRTDAVELQAFATFDFIPIIDRFMGEKTDQYNRRNTFVPYAIGGLSVLYFNPMAEYKGNYYSLRNYVTDSEKEQGKVYSPVTPVLTGGVGARFKIMEFFDIGADFTINRPFTEYLDDVSGSSKYPTWNNDFSKAPDPISYALADRHAEAGFNRVDIANTSNPYRGKGASTNNNDYYFIFNIRLDYTISSPLKFNNPRHRHFKSHKGTKHHNFNKE